MNHNYKKLIYLLIRNFLVLVFLFMISFSFYMNYIYNIKIKEQKLEIAKQDKLIQANVEIIKDDSYIPIDYTNVPEYLHDYVNCMNKGIDSNNLSGTLKNRIQRLNIFFNNNSGANGFAYEDINTGFKLGYRQNNKIFAASTTKGPLALYIYKQVDNNKLDLNEKYVYTPKYYSEGTGVIKNNPFNTTYSLDELVKNSIIYSDNVANLMLSDLVDKKQVSNYYKEKGAHNLFNSSNQGVLYQIFGEISPNDGNVYMKELYKYSLENTSNSKKLVSYFKEAALNNIKESVNKETAHKYGWTGSYVHDMALVFDENPYVLTITTTMGDSNWSEFIKLLAFKIQEIHTLYWNQVNSSCKPLLK